MTAFDFFNILRSIPKTLRFNLHYFPLKTALKLPVVVSHRTYLRELHGKVELPEKVETISVRGNLCLGDGFNMTAESTIVCAKEIHFGHDCLLSWDILVMDTDEHPLYNNENERINPDKAIHVGDHVWIGCKCVLLKGAEVPDNTVVAAGTLLTSSFAGEHQVIGGIPPSVLKRDIRWEH